MKALIPLLCCFLLVVGFFLGHSLAWKKIPSHTSTSSKAEQPAAEIAEPKKAWEGSRIQALTNALNGFPVQDLGGGTGSISGHVQTDDGSPLEGVLVQARRVKGAQFDAWQSRFCWPEATPLEREVLMAAAGFLWDEKTSLEVRTDGEGAFSLPGLADVLYTVSATLAGFSIEPKESQADSIRPNATIDFLASPVFFLSVSVRMQDGSEPAAAWVGWKPAGVGPAKNQWHRWKPDCRILRLKTGSYTLWGLSMDEQRRSEEVILSLQAGNDLPKPVLVLLDRPGIQGNVIFEDRREGEDNVSLFALRFEPGNAPSRMNFMSEAKQTIASAESGFSFVFPDLEPGLYRVGVAREWMGDIVVTKDVEVADHLASCELRLPKRDAGAHADVTLWVYAPNGEILWDVEVSVMASGMGGGNSGVSRKKDGSFRIRPLGEDTENTRHSIIVRSPQYGTKEVPYSPSRDREVIIRFDEPAWAGVKVHGYAGSGHEGRVRVLVTASTGKNEHAEEAYGGSFRSDKVKTLSAQGDLTFGPVAPGPFEFVLLALVEENEQDYLAVDRTTVDLIPGTTPVGLTLPPLFPLTIMFENPGVDARMRLYRSGSREILTDVKIREDGRMCIACLPAGEYKVEAWDIPNGGDMIFSVPGPEEIRFSPTQYNALAVKDPQGLLAGIGLRNGDLLVAIDGTVFENTEQMVLLFYSSMGRKKSTMTVVREGRELQLELETASLAGPTGPWHFFEFMKR